MVTSFVVRRGVNKTIIEHLNVIIQLFKYHMYTGAYNIEHMNIESKSYN
jgi:hypothetical protein